MVSEIDTFIVAFDNEDNDKEYLIDLFSIYLDLNIKFINDKENFLFATDRIVSDPNQQSYPTWPSFLDHIMIGRGYFEVFESKGQIRSVNVEEWIGGWSEYENLISDHRPILLSIPITQ